LEGAKLQRGVTINLKKQSRNGSVGSADQKNSRGTAKHANSYAPPSWEECEWIKTKDGRTERPVEPGSFPLAYGTPTGVGRVRGYGNAICSAQARSFIEAMMEVLGS
jgi:hypothetical protein